MRGPSSGESKTKPGVLYPGVKLKDVALLVDQFLIEWSPKEKGGSWRVPRRAGARSLQPAGLSVEIGYHGRLQQEVNKLTHKAGHEFGGSDIVGS